jgi:methionyl-tRNA formyltransferase
MKYRYAFFGTPSIAKRALEKLIEGGLVPTLIVTGMPKKQGRGMHLIDTRVAELAKTHAIASITPQKITPEVVGEIASHGPFDFFIVVAYGKILPQVLLDVVNGKVINIHPSLLPKYRGPSPLESVLLSDDTETGVTIMEIDKEVDHGPILIQEDFTLPKEITISELEEKSADLGASLILKIIESYVNETLISTPQDHSQSTHTKKFTKEDGNLDAITDEWEKWKKYRALFDWPGVYFTAHRKGGSVRIKIRKAHWDNGFVIDEVVPENQKPLPYAVFQKWLLD